MGDRGLRDIRHLPTHQKEMDDGSQVSPKGYAKTY